MNEFKKDSRRRSVEQYNTWYLQPSRPYCCSASELIEIKVDNMDCSHYNEYNLPIPYVLGQRLTVYSHIPSTPIPLKLDCCLEDETGRHEREKVDPIDRCLLRPLLPSHTGL